MKTFLSTVIVEAVGACTLPDSHALSLVRSHHQWATLPAPAGRYHHPTSHTLLLEPEDAPGFERLGNHAHSASRPLASC